VMKQLIARRLQREELSSAHEEHLPLV
jgi:hypothetical protein